MLVECPYCHRKYEPKPNEKYCPCCGEEIKTSLTYVNEEKNINESTVDTNNKHPLIKNNNLEKIMFVIGSCIMFLSIIFMFGQAFSLSSYSIFHYTFIGKDNSGKAYAGLIVGFIIYFIVYLINIKATIDFLKNGNRKAAIFVGVMNVLLIIYYSMYLTFKFKYTQSATYYQATKVISYSLGDGAILFLVSLGLTSLLYLLSTAFKNKE